MSNEIWKNAPGFPGYQVSNAGRVCSNGRILRVDNVKGYDRVRLYRDKHVVRMFVHRLVALAFIPNPDGLPQINHKNEIKTDNRAENLEWCTAKYNNAYGTGRERAAKSHSKAVGQYTPGGILVATYDRIKDARENTVRIFFRYWPDGARRRADSFGNTFNNTTQPAKSFNKSQFARNGRF